MTVYTFRTSLTVVGGSATVLSLDIPGGLANQLIIRANTSTTLFRARLIDDNSVTRVNYGFARGEINDQSIRLAMAGGYTVAVDNADVNDTFTVVLAVEEHR